MKNLTLLIVFTFSSTLTFAQKADYFVYANTNNFVPSMLKKMPVRLSHIDPNIGEEHIVGIGIERRTKRFYTRTDIEFGKDKGGTSQQAYDDHRTYKQFRLGMGVQLINKDNGFLLSAGLNLGYRSEIRPAYVYSFIPVDSRDQRQPRVFYAKEEKTINSQSTGVDLNVEFPLSKRFNIQLRSNLYVYENKETLFIAGGNFNTMAGISYRVSK